MPVMRNSSGPSRATTAATRASLLPAAGARPAAGSRGHGGLPGTKVDFLLGFAGFLDGSLELAFEFQFGDLAIHGSDKCEYVAWAFGGSPMTLFQPL